MSLKRPIIVAVDGPAGSGKSSICATVCKDIGWSYVNTGALYRAVALFAYDRSVRFSDHDAMTLLVKEFADKASWHHDTASLYIGDSDFTPRIGTVEAATGASAVAKMPEVRDALTPLQRKLSLSAPHGVMVDGRDIGTVIFPDADLKIFMTASLEQRALRRLRQLELSGDNELNLEDIVHAIAKRDQQDSQRDAAPLRKADDALTFDTSHMDIPEAIINLKALLKERSLI